MGLFKGIAGGAIAVCSLMALPVAGPIGTVTLGMTSIGTGFVGFMVGALSDDMEGDNNKLNENMDDNRYRLICNIRLKGLEDIMRATELRIGNEAYNSEEIKSIFNTVYADIMDGKVNNINIDNYNKYKLVYEDIDITDSHVEFIRDTNLRILGLITNRSRNGKLSKSYYKEIKSIVESNLK